MSHTNLVDKVAIVTGGGGEIGKAIALELAKAGMKIVIAEINEATGCQAVKELSEMGFTAYFVRTDVTDTESVKHMVAETVDQYGRLDVAVNNAACQPDAQKISELDEKVWLNNIHVNMTSVAFCLKWQLQQMIKQGHGGAIVNLSSSVALRPVARLPAYTAAKQGVGALTAIAALENGCHGIRVNAIAPGATKTAMLVEALAAMGTDPETYAENTYLLKRVATVEEVAEGVRWLASEKAAFVTGVVLPMDGGFKIN